MTPNICTIVISRKIQSSVSYADANQVKLIHAQETENAAKANPRMPSATWSWAREWASASAATPKAITKVRSKSSSRGVAARCAWCGSRPRMATRPCRVLSGMGRSLGTGRGRPPGQTAAPRVSASPVRLGMPSLR